MSADELHSIYGDEIKAFIQKCTEQSYANGIDYVQRAKQVQIPLTSEDVFNIQATTNRIETEFWQSVRGLKNRQMQQEMAKDRKDHDALFDPKVLLMLNASRLSSTLANRYAANITTSSLASGVMTGAKRAVRMQSTLPSPRFLGQAAEGEITITGRVGIEEEIIYIFKTEEDDAVCDQCEPLNDMEMSESMGNLEIPPIHSNCRCRLTFKI